MEENVREHIEYFFEEVSWKKIPEVGSLLTKLVGILTFISLVAWIGLLCFGPDYLNWLGISLMILFFPLFGITILLGRRSDAKTQQLRDKWVEDQRPEIERLIKETLAALDNLEPLKKLTFMVLFFRSEEVSKDLQAYLAADPETGRLGITRFIVENGLIID